MKTSFASDNYAGIHADVLQAIIAANHGSMPAYGGDEITARVEKIFAELFGIDTQSFLVFNGTGANVMALNAMTQSFQAIICSEKSHIQMDECGAPEKLLGSKLLLVPTLDGKITPEGVRKRLQRIGDQHHVQPKVISISQVTEYGTVYTVDEIQALADIAHENQLYLHMDGARIANAAASLGTDLKTCTRDAGVDILSFGGTKNGLMIGEAILVFNTKLAKYMPYLRKQSMQLASKMRFIAAQFEALLSNNLWLDNASHANAMAQLLASRLLEIPEIKITQKVDANSVFAIFPPDLIQKLQQEFYFYVWDESQSEVRLMTSFASTESEINSFADAIGKSSKSRLG